MKKMICSLICLAMLVSTLSVCASDFENKDYVCMMIDMPAAVVNGAAQAIEVAPYIEDDRTMLPIRFVCESLDADVLWDDYTKTATISKDDIVLKLTINEKVIYKNDAPIQIDCASKILNSRTMVPVRAIAEGLGKNVYWQDGVIAIYDKTDMSESDEKEFQNKILSDVEKILKDNNVLPSLVNISLGGQMIKDFDPTVMVYTLRTSIDDISKVHLSVTPDKESEYEVIMPKELPGEIVINVKSKHLESLKNTYYVRLKEPVDFTVQASSFQKGNWPENSFDEDFNTRWSAEGEQRIIYTLKEERELDKIQIAFWQASKERKSIIKILVGPDYKTMKTVFSGQTTSETEELEDFVFEKQKVKYIMIYCFGNTVNDWNSILEIKF